MTEGRRQSLQGTSRGRPVPLPLSGHSPHQPQLGRRLSPGHHGAFPPAGAQCPAADQGPQMSRQTRIARSAVGRAQCPGEVNLSPGADRGGGCLVSLSWGWNANFLSICLPGPAQPLPPCGSLWVPAGPSCAQGASACTDVPWPVLNADPPWGPGPFTVQPFPRRPGPTLVPRCRGHRPRERPRAASPEAAEEQAPTCHSSVT